MWQIKKSIDDVRIQNFDLIDPVKLWHRH